MDGVFFSFYRTYLNTNKSFSHKSCKKNTNQLPLPVFVKFDTWVYLYTYNKFKTIAVKLLYREADINLVHTNEPPYCYTECFRTILYKFK